MQLQEILTKKEMDVIKSDPKEITLQDPKTKIKTVVPNSMLSKDPSSPNDPNSVKVNKTQKQDNKKIRQGQKLKVTTDENT